MNSSELCVPAAALAASDEQGGAVPPGVGDEVEFMVRGNVSRAEGDKVYVTPTSANGEPLQAAGGPMTGEPDEDDEGSMDAAVEGYRAQSGAGMVLALLAFLLGWWGVSQAQSLKEATAREISPVATNNWVATTSPSQVYSVGVHNTGASTVYLLIFDSATNQLVNARPSVPAIQVPSGSTGTWDWGAAGCPFYFGVNAAISTTPYTLTNAAAVGDMVVVRRRL